MPWGSETIGWYALSLSETGGTSTLRASPAGEWDAVRRSIDAGAFARSIRMP
ncbi:hypothetical protein [Microbacterium schleiferi]|uniref:hypothetical protein n=1 Tax=Microbacterium schleiferi TaxID=69362 RepID=UPI00311E49CB